MPRKLEYLETGEGYPFCWSGWCHCGCGRRTPVADRGHNRHRWRRNQPKPYFDKDCGRLHSRDGLSYQDIEKEIQTKTKICSSCKKCLDWSAFNKKYFNHPERGHEIYGRHGLEGICRDCKLMKSRIRTYGKDCIDLISNTKLFCGICSTKLTKNSAHVDHCHATERVRGVLCQSCNHGLGNFKDSPQRLQSAIDYLKKHQTKSTK